MTAPPGMRAVAAMLANRIVELVIYLMGEPPTARHNGELRFRHKGSLQVITAGPRRGTWFDYDPPPGGRPPGPKGVSGGDALDLVAHLRGCGRREALAWARVWLGEAAPHRRSHLGPTARPAAPARPALGGGTSFSMRIARELWAERLLAEGSPVVTYLRSRGLELPGDAPLRFHPDAWRNRQCGPPGPAMLALMTDPLTGEPTGVHVTYLAPGGRGKAGGGRPKIMLGRAGVVRLAPDEEVTRSLGLTEGIENALAVMQRHRWRPVWAAGSAGGIAGFPVLPGIEALWVFADADDGGTSVEAARRCAARWRQAGRRVWLVMPRRGEDFNDMLRRAMP